MTHPTAAGTPVRAPAAARVPSLTGLRWVAAFLVFGFHAQAEHVFGDPTAQGVVFAVFGQGATGVDFFFVLSGFVLTWSARPGTSARQVWRRRAAKVMPNHVVTWLVALAGMLYVSPRGVSLVSSVVGLFLLQSWVPVQSVYFAGNTPSWSLSCEAAFYFAFPLLLLWVNRIRDRQLWPVAIALVVVVVQIPALVLPAPTGTAYWVTYIFPLSRMVEFALGMVLARIVRAGRWIGVGLAPSMALCVLAYWLSAYLPGMFGAVAATVIPISLLVCSAAVADVNGTWSPWRHPVCVRLGELSFAFYLLHQIVLRFADKAFHLSALPTATAAGLTVGLLVVTVGAAWLLFNTVEQPMMRLLRGR
ncbi:acyltransferase family protein [Kutzneria kofuensis]|uniref:Peptidoglycan/LPS O-acetylase OafA/YrhL n=1 Tax=Kutzneria kofuensis TaxID=103725 RepID=A0A7W9NGF8_9PSEU|nr:acyltransferase [Kutzneria kofuensis]MBB5891111.1 peptidoglycan/LPS O-acetylase OafA/YrhL [Kutzneria kofuensis]